MCNNAKDLDSEIIIKQYRKIYHPITGDPKLYIHNRRQPDSLATNVELRVHTLAARYMHTWSLDVIR